MKITFYAKLNWKRIFSQHAGRDQQPDFTMEEKMKVKGSGSVFFNDLSCKITYLCMVLIAFLN